MATLEQLQTAIKNAEAAGDTEAVKRLIPAYKTARDAANKPPPTAAETAADVAQAIPSGLRRGYEALIGFPGDIKAGAEAGANWFARRMGYTEADIAKAEQLKGGKNLLGVDTGLPSTSKIHAATTPIFGESYEPKTTPGQYAQTGAEFAASGGRRIRNIATAAFGGLLSEGAGQYTKGTDIEPYARIAGGLIQPAASAGWNLLRAGPTTEAARALEAQGIPLTAGQATGRNRIQFAENEIGGNRYQNIIDAQRQAYTGRAMELAGAPAGTSAQWENLRDLRANLGNQFDQMAAGTSVPMDQTLQNSILNTATNYAETAPNVVPAVESAMNRLGQLAAQNGGVLTGQNYKDFTTYLREAAATADPPTQEAFNQIRTHLDDAVERSMPQGTREQWRDLRSNYRNLLTIEKSMTGGSQEAAEGFISPTRLRTSIGTVGGPASIAEGRSNMTDLANQGVLTMKPMPQSGTAARSQARGIGIPIVSELWGAAKGGALMSPIVQNVLRQTPEPQGRAALAAIIAAQQGKPWEGY
jgi:hypothetical protein